MGVSTETFGFIHQCLMAAIPDLQFKGKQMVELGDQKFNAHVALTPEGDRVWTKEYFKKLGFTHLCIDWHGQNGAVSLDLAKPFYVGQFDVLTNLGTSEHILDQHYCWQNMHNLVKPGGILIHVVPKTGALLHHSPYSYETKFFKHLANLNNYRMLFMQYLCANGCHAVCMHKQEDQPFIWDSTGLVNNEERIGHGDSSHLQPQ